MELRIQCIMLLFVNETFRICSIELEASAANSDNIELDVMTDGVPVHWSGFTDLKCCHAGSTSIHDAVATIE